VAIAWQAQKCAMTASDFLSFADRGEVFADRAEAAQ
jgi:hypothetical protein